MYFILIIKDTKYVKRAHTFIHKASYWLFKITSAKDSQETDTVL